MGNDAQVQIGVSLNGIQQLESQVKGIQRTFENFKGAVAGGFAGFGLASIQSQISALVSFGKESTTTATELGKLSKQLGESVEQMSKFSYAMGKSGDEAKTLFGHFERWQAEHGRSKEGLIPGVLETAELLNQLHDPANRTELVIERFGKTGQDLLPKLLKGADGIRELMEQSERLGVTTTEDVEIAGEFKKALNDQNFAFEKLHETLATTFLPVLTKYEEQLTSITVAARKFVEEHKAMLQALTPKSLGSLFGSILSPAGTITGALTSRLLTGVQDLAGGVQPSSHTPDQRVAIGEIPELSSHTPDTRVDPIVTQGQLDRQLKAIENAYKLAAANRSVGEINLAIDDQQQARFDEIGRELAVLQRQREILADTVQRGALKEDEANALEVGYVTKIVQLLRERQRIELEMSKKAPGALYEAQFREANLKRNYADSVSKISGSKFLTEAQKYEKTLQTMNAEADRLIALSMHEGQLSTTETNPEIQAQHKANSQAAFDEYLKQSSKIDVFKANTIDPNSFTQNFAAGLKGLADQIGNTSQLIARNLTDFVGGAITSVSDGITGLIEGTRTWGDLFKDVTHLIVRSIVNMVVQWIAQMTILAVVKKLLGRGENTEAAAATAAWTPAAVAASIASYGSASFAGASAFAAALSLSSALAVGMSSAGFKTGGFTGFGSNDDIAGITHRNEFVMPADATSRIGVANLEAMRRGAPIAGPSARGSVHIGVLSSRDEFRQFMESAHGEKIIFDTMQRRRIDYGLPT